MYCTLFLTARILRLNQLCSGLVPTNTRVHAELSEKSQKTYQRTGQETLTTQIVLFNLSYSISNFVKWQLCDSSAACSAAPSVIGVKRAEGSISVFVLPGLGFKMAMGPTMCGISAILYTPCQGVGSQGCRFHTDLKHTQQPGVSVVQTKDAVTHKRNILTLLSATCYVCTSVHRLLTATYSHPGWWGLLELIPVVTEQDTSTHLLDRLPVHCRAHTALSHTQRATKSKKRRKHKPHTELL